MNYKLKDLIDIPKLQALLDTLDQIHCMPSAIIDIEGNILTATAWQDICTKFHRVNPEIEKKCKESDNYITKELDKNPPNVIYKCPMGLVDTATPIILDGHHLGNVFTGQLFIEPPDEEKFIQQAQEYGFKEKDYLEALRKVPIISEERLQKNLEFLSELATMLASEGLINKRQLEIEQTLRNNQAVIEERNHFIESIINLSPDILYIYDITNRQNVYSNNCIQTILGYTPEEIKKMGRDMITMLMHPYDLNNYFKKILPRYADAKDNEHIIHEYRMKHKDGEWRWLVSNEIIYLRKPDGTPTQIFGMIQDITEHKRSDEKLQNMYYLLNETGKLANIGGWEFYTDTMEMIWTEEVYRIHEVAMTYELSVNAAISFYTPESRPVIETAVNRAIEHGEPFDLKLEIITAKGNKRWVHAIGHAEREQEKTKRVLGIFQDITEHRRLEEQLRQAQKMEGIGTLAGGVAHDFNNILSAIVGYGHLALMGMDKNDSQKKNIEAILEAADRAATLTKALLLFGRKQSSVLKAVDLNGIIKTVEKFMKRVIGEDIEIRTTLQNWPILVLADYHQMEQVLMNLATNSRDAMPKGGTFSIMTEEVLLDKEFCSVHAFGRPGRYALISISDTGCGMDKETIKRMYDPFFTTKEVGKGTGLGLAVVYGIVKQHDGYIDICSEVGIGTTFKIYLPVTESAPAEQRPSDIKEKSRFGTETVLIAEDDETLRKLLHSILTHHGYEVIVSIDGEDAISKFKDNREKIQLLLFDLVMPKMNGADAYNEIRKIRPDIKAIFVSGYSPDVVRQKVILDKDAVLIYKPVSPFYMLRKIREVLDNIKSSSVEIP